MKAITLAWRTRYLKLANLNLIVNFILHFTFILVSYGCYAELMYIYYNHVSLQANETITDFLHCRSFFSSLSWQKLLL